MFDIAWSELLLIAVVALIFIGPKELPGLLNNLGRAAAKLRRSADEFRRHFEESMREAGYEDLHKNINDLRSLNPSSQLRSTIDSAINQNYGPRQPPAGTQPSAPPSFVHPSPQTEAAAPTGEAADGSAPGPAAASQAEASASIDAAMAEGAQKPAVEASQDHSAPAA